MVDEVLELPDALTADMAPSEGLATAVKIIKNAHADIRVSIPQC
jgi:hypothetical protein